MKKLPRTAPAHEMRPPDPISKRVRVITQWVYKKRVPLLNEAQPPENNLWQRPVYNPATDNR
jgi:hypothetical protein